MKNKLVTLAVVMLAGCATQPDKIQSAYVSPVQYKDYDCDQISAESARVSRRASELHSNLKSTADNDGAQMAVGMILFWPALFFLEGGDGPEAAEYARLTVIATRATPDDERDYGVEDGGGRSRNILAARPRKLT